MRETREGVKVDGTIPAPDGDAVKDRVRADIVQEAVRSKLLKRPSDRLNA